MGTPRGTGLTDGAGGEVAEWIRQTPRRSKLGGTDWQVLAPMCAARSSAEAWAGRALGGWGTTRGFAAERRTFSSGWIAADPDVRPHRPRVGEGHLIVELLLSCYGGAMAPTVASVVGVLAGGFRGMKTPRSPFG